MIYNNKSVMDLGIDHRPLSPERLMLLNSCIYQSRTSLFYTEDEHHQTNSHQDTSIVVQTRKFKLEIEDKFLNSEHNHKYFFPRDLSFGWEDVDEEQQQIVRSLANSRFQVLAQQNNHREEAFQKLIKSRCESTVGLFKQALEVQKQQSRPISKSKGRESTNIQTPMPSLKFKRVTKDKQNNLNFQNLREQRDASANASVSKSKGKLPSPSNSSSVKPKKINIPRINLSDRSQQPKCFRDLAKLDNRRR